MRWTIRGANRETGLDVETDIEASNEQEATRIAGEHGILVASIEPSLAKATTTAPAYQEIIESAWVIKALGTFLAVSGAVLILAGVITLIVGLSKLTEPALPSSMSAGVTIASAAAAMACGVFYIGAGAMLHLIAASALALRDIARSHVRY